METGSDVGWFGLPTGSSPSRLLRALHRAGYLADPPTVSRYECLFVETQDGRLARQGYRLSIRHGRNGTVWHLSGPEGEKEEPFEGDLAFRSLSPDAAGIFPAAAELGAGRLLFPLVRLRVFDWTTHVHGPAGSALRLRVERFTAAPPREAWPKGSWPHGRLSVRLLDGDPAEFLHIVTYLRDRLGLPAGAGDACGAALQSLSVPEPGAPVPAHLSIRPEDSQALAGRKVVGQQALKMKANVNGTLEDLDPEYLHDLRVAIRRLRSALRLFAEVLGPRRCDSLRVELNWIAQLLGAVRDLDVFILNLREQAQRLGEAGVIAEILAEELGRQRAPAREALASGLAARRFRDLMRRLETLASSPPPRHHGGAKSLPVAKAAPALIRKAQRRVLKLGRTIGPGSAAADLHRLRILFKRLRYASEFFREAFADPASDTDPLADYIQAMVRFQDCLGEHQDAVVAMARIQELVTEMVERGALAPERLLDLGGLIQVQREIARDRRGRLAKLWAKFDRRSVRRRLAALGGESPQVSRAAEASEAVSASGWVTSAAFTL
jgi:CHAD domain-containing protein